MWNSLLSIVSAYVEFLGSISISGVSVAWIIIAFSLISLITRYILMR